MSPDSAPHIAGLPVAGECLLDRQSTEFGQMLVMCPRSGVGGSEMFVHAAPEFHQSHGPIMGHRRSHGPSPFVRAEADSAQALLTRSSERGCEASYAAKTTGEPPAVRDSAIAKSSLTRRSRCESGTSKAPQIAASNSLDASFCPRSTSDRYPSETRA